MVNKTRSSKFHSTVEYMRNQRAKTGSDISFGPDNASYANFWT
jgi:hypothetical protein